MRIVVRPLQLDPRLRWTFLEQEGGMGTFFLGVDLRVLVATEAAVHVRGLLPVHCHRYGAPVPLRGMTAFAKALFHPYNDKRKGGGGEADDEQNEKGKINRV